MMTYADRVVEILSDGALHYEAELIHALSYEVPPERAVEQARRQRRNSGVKGAEPDLETLRERGAKQLLCTALRGLARRKRIQCEGLPRQWRLVPQEAEVMA